MRIGHLEHLERGVEVHLHLPLHLLKRDLIPGNVLLHGGVADDDIRLHAALAHLREDVRNGARARKVARHGEGRRRERPHCGKGLIQRLRGLRAMDHDAGAEFGEPSRDGAADAARASRHEGATARQIELFLQHNQNSTAM